MKKRLILTLALCLACLCSHAQKVKQGTTYMYYYLDEAGDTVYMDVIPPAWVFPKGSRVDKVQWRRYCKLVYNFNKVYPYALLGKELVRETDEYIAKNGLNRLQKDRYILSIQKDLLENFESVVRHMTISQGQLLVRLVDREIGKSSFSIVKDYKSGLAAGFWQGVAKLFGQNLKNRYDPNGEDKETEELVRKWERGEFDDLYFSLFWEPPKKTVLPEKYR